MAYAIALVVIAVFAVPFLTAVYRADPQSH